jgi:hypothetical protein
MRRVASLLSDLFSSSFRLAVPSLFRGMVQKCVQRRLMFSMRCS